MPISMSIALTGEHHEQAQQVHEQIQDIEEQPDRRHDVIGLAAANDVAHIVQEVKREDQHGNGRQRHRERGYLQKGIGQHRYNEQYQADEQEFAEEAEISLGNGGDRRHDEEHGSSHSTSERDELAAIS